MEIDDYKRKSADFVDNRIMLFDYSEMSEEQLACAARHVIDSINDSKVSGANQVSIEHLETCIEIGLKQGE